MLSANSLKEAKRKRSNIVLCYHGCVKNRNLALTFREHEDDIKSQVNDLLHAGYTFVKPSDYFRWYDNQYTPTTPVACIQLDDGLDSITSTCNWFVSQAIHFGIAVISRRQRKYLPEDGFLNWQTIRGWVDSGYCEILRHTHNIHNLMVAANDGTPAPVMETPCWLDAGDFPYIRTGDTRWYWDFSHVDANSWGFPLFGSDPYTGWTTAITSEVTIVPRTTGTVTQLRLWAALHRPYGSGYSCNVNVYKNNVLLGQVTVAPKAYETRTQWVEREFLTVTLPASFAITSGTPVTLKFVTQNTGNGCFVIYSLPEFVDTGFFMTTNCQSLVEGRKGPDFADYPAGKNWPARACIILSMVGGRQATDNEYSTYIAADTDAQTAAVEDWLRCTWTETSNGYNPARTNWSLITLAGTYENGGLADTKIAWTAPANMVLETLSFKQAGEIGWRYAAVVWVYIGTSATGPWTKIAEWIPGWSFYHWFTFDIDPQTVVSGTTYWFRFETKNQSQNEGQIVDVLQADGSYKQVTCTKLGLIAIYLDQPQPNYGRDQNFYGLSTAYVTLDGVVVQTQRVIFWREEDFWFTDQAPTGYVAQTLHTDLWISNIHVNADFSTTWYYYGHIIGKPMMKVYSSSKAASGITMPQLVYPFGAVYTEGMGGTLAKPVPDIHPALASVFTAKSINSAYTIWPARNDVKTRFREPDCRCTAHTLSRFLVYGDVHPSVTSNNLALLGGFRYPDAQHGGIKWQVSTEPDVLGNATIRNSYTALEYVAFDAWFFDALGNIIQGPLADGGTYLSITTRTGNFVAGETITEATTGWSATVVWAANNIASEYIKVSGATGTYVGGHTITGGTSGATATGVLAILNGLSTYADDKLFLKNKGVYRSLIINNNLATGDPDPAVGTAVVVGAATYIPKIVSVCVNEGWDGITCNLEAIPQVNRSAATSFYQQLGAALHAVGKFLHCTAPARTNTAYDLGSEWWWGWCDHVEIIKHVDAMKIMTYTETGPGTPPGPHAPDWFVTATYDYLDSVIYPDYRPRILVGVNAFGHIWHDSVGTLVDYGTYHDCMAEAIRQGTAVDDSDGEATFTSRGLTAWFGTPSTILRAVNIALDRGYGGVGVWKADDGDLDEHFPTQLQLGRDEAMAFFDLLFPDSIAFGAVGGPGYKTGVNNAESGDEQRTAGWVNPRHQYEVGFDFIDQTKLDTLVALFRVVRGRYGSFRFRDWSDYSATAQTLGTGDGIILTFQLKKRYSSGAYYVDRTITKPRSGTLSVYLNGVLQSSGWTCNYLTGVISFTVAPGAGVVVSADFQFDVQVRFDIDKLPSKLDAVARYNLSSIALVEVRR